MSPLLAATARGRLLPNELQAGFGPGLLWRARERWILNCCRSLGGISIHLIRSCMRPGIHRWQATEPCCLKRLRQPVEASSRPAPSPTHGFCQSRKLWPSSRGIELWKFGLDQHVSIALHAAPVWHWQQSRKLFFLCPAVLPGLGVRLTGRIPAQAF